jgi:hypothetical protein
LADPSDIRPQFHLVVGGHTGCDAHLRHPTTHIVVNEHGDRRLSHRYLNLARVSCLQHHANVVSEYDAGMDVEQSVRAIAESKEVLIETSDSDQSARTIIWTAPHEGEIYIRSYLGDRGVWYQRALANPEVVLSVGEVSAPMRAVPARDDESIEAATQGFLDKYGPSASRDAMVADGVLHTTMRLESR